MKRLLSMVMAAAMALSLVACGGTAASGSTASSQAASSAPASSQAESVPASSAVSASEDTAALGDAMRIAGLQGPTTMGMVKLMKDQESMESPLYDVTMYGAADEIVPLLTKGELDAAAIPANLAATLYQKTEGKIQVAAVNTLGVLYVVTTGDDVASVADLAGKTIYSTGKGTTPEYVLNYILTENGIDPAKDVTIEYKSEATEVLSTLQSAGEGAVAVLPQPYVTAAQAQVEGLNVALDLTEEWNKIDPDSQLITGVLAVRSDYAEQHPEELEVFLADYRSSIEWVTANTADAAQLVAEYGIVAKAPLAEKALPACNITYMDGADMKQALSGYLDVLYQQDAASVGGALPGDDFYYGVE
ncbi:ABC transporter substrate-binding protein [Allofournierella massiliensis]|uniref:NitT/TauT family transport system substrate-binding protein n=1 Tax=Allofournierella massiliensis TaxID=1650663 RepID=A0A4R1QPS7_9FIRM|nr:MqnA/MqnD/SBP family protein [Fournierella massiliensis]TCL55819.1 NitT/TauT family transport system substrate-binding protein [Fournierella massiliensis]